MSRVPLPCKDCSFREQCRARLLTAGWTPYGPIPYGNQGKSTTLWERPGAIFDPSHPNYAVGEIRYTFRQAVKYQADIDFYDTLPNDEKAVE